MNSAALIVVSTIPATETGLRIRRTFPSMLYFFFRVVR